MVNRTIALAVDGMEPSLVSRWIEAGALPNIQSLCEDGSFGTARCSSLSSAKQWTTHFTGVDSQTHGVSGFLKGGETRTAGDDAPSSRELINLTDIRSLTYPELLDNDRVGVGLINPLPIWPPLRMDHGFCVSGMLTPPDSDRWFHPESLQEELESSEYVIDVRYGNRPYGFVDDALFQEVSLSQLERDMFEVLEARIDYTKHILETSYVTFLYSLLKSIDVIQHVFWLHMERGDSRFGEVIERAYSRVDDLVGWLLNNFPDANLVIFSDHGFRARPPKGPAAVESTASTVGRLLPSVPPLLQKLYETVQYWTSPPMDTENPNQTSGIHADPAVWMMTGPDVTPGYEGTVEFEDITPTLLALLDHPIPTRYVGSAITEALDVEPRIESIDLATDRRGYRVEEHETVSERLHNLGYAEMVDE